ncbi:MAG: pyridoxal-phosphate dependent enzyme [Gammaproteobacteria bacterium]|nr:pyridoxal-phosphate dependent enzyme [Gammaproteobacteria bacterium]
MIEIAAPQLDLLDINAYAARGVSVAVLRLDAMHPTIHGNKWFKLKYNLAEFQSRGLSKVVSVGGAYSNHLAALAAAGAAQGLKTVGIVRGEIIEPLNPVLHFAREQGMTLIPLSRKAYRELRECIDPIDNDPTLNALRTRLGDFAFLPEGGANPRAVAGCAEIVDSIDWSVFDAPISTERVVALACGTATTLAGIVCGLQLARSNEAPRVKSPRVLGIAALKGEGYLVAEANRWIEAGPKTDTPATRIDWAIDERFHCGGYAKVTPSLTRFVQRFGIETGMAVEPVYTGKLFFALHQQILAGEYPRGTQIVALHTGGIFSHA